MSELIEDSARKSKPGGRVAAEPPASHTPDPLRDVLKLRRWVRMGVYAAIFGSEPFYYFVVGYSPLQMLAGLLIGLMIAFFAIEGAFNQMIRLRKRSAYPNLLIVEVGNHEDTAGAAARGLEVVRRLLGVTAAAIVLRQEASGLRLAACSGIPADRGRDILLNSQDEVRRVLDTASPVTIELRSGAAFHRAFGLIPPGPDRIVFAPVTALQRPVGVLILACSSRNQDVLDGQLMDGIGTALGLSLENLRQRDELRAGQERLRSVVTGAPLVIFSIDADGRYTLIEGKALDTLGVRPEHFIGRSAFEMWEHRPDFIDDLRRVFSGEEVTEIVNIGPFFLEARLTPLRAANGLVTGVIGVAVNITERRLAEAALVQSEERLRTVVSNMPVVLFSIDNNGNFTLSEGKGLAALGMEPGQAVGLNVRDVYKDVPAIQENVRRALSGETVTDTVRVGSLLWETIYSPVRDANGAVSGVIGVATDVTERLRAQEELRQSEERYRELVENASDIVFTHDLSGRVMAVNGAAERILGYSREELAGMDVSGIVAPEYVDLADRMTAAKIEQGGRTTYELEVVARDGRRVPLEVSTWLAHGPEGPAAVHGIARDISERRESELAVQRREAILGAVGFAAARFLSETDYHDGMGEVLKRLGEAAGVSRVYVFENHESDDGALLTSQRFEWVSEGTAPQLDNPELQGLPYVEAGFARWVDVLGGGEPVFGAVSRFPDCERAVLEPQEIRSLAVVPIFVAGDWWGFIGFDDCVEERAWSAVEIEALKAAARLIGAAVQRMRIERAVRDSEERYRELVENSSEIIYTLDTAGNVTYISPAVRQLGGYEPEEIIGLPALSFIHQDDVQDIAESLKRTIAGTPEPSEYRLRKKSGDYVWVQTFSRPIHDDGGKIVGLRGLIVDIDQRKQAERALRESEDRYRELFDNASDIVYTHDLTGCFTSINRAAERITGYTPEEAIGTNIAKIVAPDHLQRAIDMTRQKLEGAGETTYEIDIITKDGRRLPLEVSTRIITRDGKPFGVQGIARDINARKRAEEALRESEELYRTLVETSPDAVILVNARGEIVKANGRAAALLGFADAEEMAGANGLDFITEDQRQIMLADLQESVSKGVIRDREYALARKDGTHVHCEISISALSGPEGEPRGFVSVVRDITQRRRMDAALAGEKQVLEAIATGSNLTEVLTLLTRVIEEQADGMMCSVLLLDPGGKHLRLGAAPSMPASYNRAVDGVPIGPQAGSCGTAAYRKQLVVVTDIATDPLWEAWRKDALAAGLRACWSLPIFSTRGEVIGTFAMYYREPRSPTDKDIELIERATHIAGIAIERKQAEEALEASEERYRNLVDTARDVIYTLGLDASITSLNPAFETVTGWKREDWLGKNFGPILHPDDAALNRAQFKNVLAGNSTSYELRVRRADGEYMVAELTSTPLYDNGELSGVFGIARDITERKKAEVTIRRLAYHDGLTDLPNRTLFEDRLTVALAQARRTGQMLAVLFLDLDRFKIVNDTLGHGAGDKLLRAVADDLTSVLRDGDTVARIGGDEFTILLPAINDESDAVEVAERVLNVLRGPRLIDGQEFGVTTSIGITLYPQDGGDPETLLRNADTAMYRAKEQGRNNYQLYNPAMNAGVLQRLSLENDLRHALERDELRVYYQPIAETATGRIVATEALVRWQHPSRGLVSPDEFIPFAEESGLIVSIGEWVLRQALRQNRAWQKAGHPPVRVTVNLSARQLQQEDLVAVIRDALREASLRPELLQLEITEGAVMKNVDVIISMLHQLRLMGVGISLDDFGTGYSSLSYLKRFPIDSVKIDRSFVRDIATDPNDAAIVTTVIAMARNLNLKVIAEGVENQEQLDFLKRRGCDEFQGYLISRPVEPQAARAFLEPPRRAGTRLKTA